MATTTDTVTMTRGFKISFQFAKRFLFDPKWFILTLRYGLKGIDGRHWRRLRLLPRALHAARRPSTSARTCCRACAIWSLIQPYRNLYLIGGVDDILNDRPPGVLGNTGRDFYFGGQLMFNDEDLKALLAVAGSALVAPAAVGASGASERGRWRPRPGWASGSPEARRGRPASRL